MIPPDHVILPVALYRAMLTAWIEKIERTTTTPPPPAPPSTLAEPQPASNVEAVNHSLGGGAEVFGVPEGYTSIGAPEAEHRTNSEKNDV